MKKNTLLWLLILCQMFINLGTTVDAAAEKELIRVTVDRKEVSFDTPPVMEQDRVLVPLRAVAEAMGAEVTWTEETQTAAAERDGIRISLPIGESAATVGEETVPLDVPTRVWQDRTYVPVRFFAEAFGAKVNWEDASKTVIIFTAPPEGESLFDVPMAEEPYDLMGGRLTVSMPEGSQRTPEVGNSFLCVPAAAMGEQRVWSELVSGQQVMLYVMETYMTADSDFQETARMYMEEVCDLAAEPYTTHCSSSDGGNMAIFSIEPVQPYYTNMMLWGLSLIQTKEDALIAAALYVNEEAAQWNEACDTLCENILSSIRPGTRLLQTEAREEQVEGGKLQVADGYAMYRTTIGLDYSVFYFAKVVPIGQKQPSMGIYCGGLHTPSKLTVKDGTYAGKGNILGQEIEWFYTGGDMDQAGSYTTLETRFRLGETSYYRVFINPTEEDNMLEMKQMAESLHR